MNSKFLENMLKENEKHKLNFTARFYAVRQYLLVRALSKIAKNSKRQKKLTENQIRYLTENFPKIQEYMLSMTGELLRIKGVKSIKGQPLYMAFFRHWVENYDGKIDENALKELFDKANGTKPYPELSDSGNFILYLKCAVCGEICRFYINNTGDGENNDKKLQRLFLLLDEADFFPQSLCISSNPCEKLLCRDEVYVKCSEETKNSIRKNLALKAKKVRLSQLEYAERISKGENFFTSALCDRPMGGQVYIILHVFLTVLFTFFLCVLSPLFVFAVVPVYRCVKIILDRFFCRFAVKNFTLPSLDLDIIPDGKGVLVTVTTLLSGKEKDGDFFRRLEKMYFSCGGKNVYFCLLCDLADSDELWNKNDEETVKNARDNVLKLRKKYGDVFYLMLRDRAYSKSEECFTSPERKRGAVNMLTCFLCGKSDGFSAYSIKMSEDVCKNVKYIFTLDADTNLAFDCVKKAVGIMLHPNNVPVTDKNKGSVVKGYGILQPKMNTSLESASRSFFAWMMNWGSGVDSYSSAGYDLPMALFGKGVFCGKGMFDKDVFYEVLCKEGAFKNNTVLSHDAPEGALLRCAVTPLITLTDSFPKEQMSYNKRRHRWIRGDVQNIHFFPSVRENALGKIINNGIDFTSKYLMAENIADALLCPFCLVLVVMSVLCREKTVEIMAVTLSVSAFVLPFVHYVASAIRKALFYNASRLFYSKGIYGGIWAEFFTCIYRISSIAGDAYLCSDAVLRALFRMAVSKKHTLQWTTAAQSDRESRDGILGYVKKNLFSAFCGAFLVVMTQNAFVRLTGLLWLALPFTAFYSGRERKKEKTVITEETRSALIENLRDMWRFFEDNVNENTHFLVPDNLSMGNGEKISFMTSPTNIGLYLACCTAVCKAGLITFEDLKRRCSDTLDTVERMPKYKGLLYNWYDVRTAECLKPYFVSSVDEGNFIACLYVVKGALLDFSCDKTASELARRIQNHIDKANLEFMYNEKRQLFHIGFTVNQDESVTFTKNCYDMLMSETRTLSYIATAQKSVDTKHFYRLSRPLVKSGRFTGLASWSGTVFEYFMPCLFLPVQEGSITYEALEFALMMNKKTAADNGVKVFGISESCYNEFDDGGNYKYRAFGCEKLSLCVFELQKVISPYSTYLFSEFDLKASFLNLSELYGMGVYGKYGFYESVDFEHHTDDEGYGVVKCFMSHHIGMSICALSNLIFDGYIRKCFMSDGRMKSADELLMEKIPMEVRVKKRARRYFPKLSKPLPVVEERTTEKTDFHEKTQESKNINKNFDVEIVCGDGNSVFKKEIKGQFVFEKESKMYKSSIFEIEMFSAVREPAIIVNMKTCCGEKIRFMMSFYEKCNVTTQTGGVVFCFEDVLYYCFGFLKDADGNVLQGVCRHGERKSRGEIVFEEREGEREYTFVLGKAKNFDGMNNAFLRVFYEKQQVKKKAKQFHTFLKTDFSKIGYEEEKMLHGICEKKKYADFVIPVLDADDAVMAGKALLLMYTSHPLRRYVVTELVRMLWDSFAFTKERALVVCAAFCVYCTRLDTPSLKEFVEENTVCYRLVIKQLAGMKDNERDSVVYKACEEMLGKICTRLGDDAVRRILGLR